jgi:hypothetical protein
VRATWLGLGGLVRLVSVGLGQAGLVRVALGCARLVTVRLGWAGVGWAR